MRGKQSTYVSCRHNVHSLARITLSRRISTIPSTEPTALSRLTIDLDTADSTVIWKAHDVPATRRKSREHLPVVKCHQPRPKKVLLDRQVTPIDLWAYALLGISESNDHRASRVLHQIFKDRGLRSVDRVSHVVAELVYDFSIDPHENLQRARFSRENEQAILDQMQWGKTFSELCRLISMLSSTQDGCNFLCRNETDVLEAIRINRRRQQKPYAERVSSSEVLNMLNNLHLNLESRGLKIGLQLCTGALYYASKSCSVAAVKKYLYLARKNNYAPNVRVKRALNALFKWLVTEHHHLKDENRKIEALELITGWRGGFVPRKGVLRMTSFAYLCYSDTSQEITHALYPAYILGLGEMGLQKAIYAEWMAKDPKRMNSILLGDEHVRFRAQLFAIALLLAKDENRALEVLNSVPADHNDISTPRDEEGMRSWHPLNQLAAFEIVPTPNSSNVWLLSVLWDHYIFHDCIPISDLQKRLAAVISRMPRDPKLAMEILQGMLLRDPRFMPRKMDSPWQDYRSISWYWIVRNRKWAVRINSKRWWFGSRLTSDS